jgi:hypothetical protein
VSLSLKIRGKVERWQLATLLIAFTYGSKVIVKLENAIKFKTMGKKQ